MYGLLVWIYAGYLIGILAKASREASYGYVSLLPLMFSLGLPPRQILLGFVIIVATSGLLNLAFTRNFSDVKNILRSPMPILGAITGAFLFAFLPFSTTEIVMATALTAVGLKIAYESLRGRELNLEPRSRLLREVTNFSVGMLDATLGLAVSFALIRTLIGPTLEALIPMVRLAEAATVIVIKGYIVAGGIAGGVGFFLAQRSFNPTCKETNVTLLKLVVSVMSFLSAALFYIDGLGFYNQPVFQQISKVMDLY